MKKSAMLSFFLILILLISACSSTAPSDSPQPDAAWKAEDPTVSELCSDTLTAFEDDASANPIASMAYRDGQAHDFEVTDADVITEIYQALLTVPLGITTDDPGISDADILFSFVRENGEEFTLRFVTQQYFALYRADDAQWIYYVVEDASLVRYCQDAATAASQSAAMPERPLFGSMFALNIVEDCSEDIDLDGDGKPDSLYFDFIDNGDEAFDALNLSVDTADGSFQTSFYPGGKDIVFACGVPYADDRSLLLIATDAMGGWPGLLCFMKVENGKLKQYTLEDVEITGYDNGVFSLSDTREIAVSQMRFEAVPS